jgi:hypothetical protein
MALLRVRPCRAPPQRFFICQLPAQRTNVTMAHSYTVRQEKSVTDCTPSFVQLTYCIWPVYIQQKRGTAVEALHREQNAQI